MPRGGGTSNGGVIGKTNKTSFGKDITTVKTSTGAITTQPGTRVVQAAIVAGGGGAGDVNPGNVGSGGGGAGGVRNIQINVSGGTPYTATVGAGGAGNNNCVPAGGNGSNSSFACQSSTGGGGSGRGSSPLQNSNPGGS